MSWEFQRDRTILSGSNNSKTSKKWAKNATFCREFAISRIWSVLDSICGDINGWNQHGECVWAHSDPIWSSKSSPEPILEPQTWSKFRKNWKTRKFRKFFTKNVIILYGNDESWYKMSEKTIWDVFNTFPMVRSLYLPPKSLEGLHSARRLVPTLVKDCSELEPRKRTGVVLSECSNTLVYGAKISFKTTHLSRRY